MSYPASPTTASTRRRAATRIDGLERSEEAIRALRRAVSVSRRRSLAPPPKLTTSQWADEYRFLSAESSSEPGKWNTARVEPARGIMDAFSDPRVERVTVMVCAQLLKTEVVNNRKKPISSLYFNGLRQRGPFFFAHAISASVFEKIKEISQLR